MNNDELFRQALQRQNDRASEMKMPDDMEQRVMNRIKPRAKSRRWLYGTAVVGVAASLLLLLTLHNRHVNTDETTVVAQQTEQLDKPNDTEKLVQEVPTTVQETPAASQVAKAEPKVQARQRRKKHIPAANVAEQVEVQDNIASEDADQRPEPQEQMADPFLMAEMHAQQIRTRGMRLYEEIEQQIKN